MNLTEHFTLQEFIKSAWARRTGVDNSLPATMLPEAQRTCQLLERIRSYLWKLHGGEVPIIVSSGYRCLLVNRAAGSKDSSDHLQAMAADFEAPGFGTPYQVAQALAAQVETLGIGQLIHEFGDWVHVSTKVPDKQINRVITISSRGTQVGVVEA